MNDKKEILAIAHRGANTIAPENTLKAFQKAIELGADFIEFDLWRTKDGHLMVSHDNSLLRRARKIGFMTKKTLSELRSLTVGDNEKIPLLSEVITLAKGKIGLMCELKARNIASEVVEILEKEGMLDSSIIISFHHEQLVKIKKSNPSIKVGAILPTGVGWILNWIIKKPMITSASKHDFFSINLFYPLINKAFVDLAHKKGLLVYPWTVNSKKTMKKLIKLGVDGILTNDIQALKSELNPS